MSFVSLFFIAAGLSMDAFAVSVCKGLAMPKISLKSALATGLWFGGFQALMPAAGYLAGSGFQEKIQFLDHWVAFLLLGLIGVGMIRESFSKPKDCPDPSLKCRVMFPLAVATSIDALAVGVSFAFLPGVPIVPAVAFIGLTTFFLSAVGLKIGNVFGVRYKSGAELAGGIILILMGAKILLEHTGVIG